MRALFMTFFIFPLILISATAFAFMAEGGGAGSCIDCHVLSKEDAIEIFKQIGGEVQAVEHSEVPGLWRVEVNAKGKTIPLYLDYSKSFMIAGDVIRLEDRKNLTDQRFQELNSVDTKTIPLNDALLLGKENAKNKVLVFTDPHCPYCSKLHIEMQAAVEKRPDIAFLIKLLPYKNSSKIPTRTILCNKSLAMLEDAFTGKQLPPPICDTDQGEQNILLARELGIRSTPTLLLPNGQIEPGYKKLDDLIKLIDQATLEK
ncbi:MAG TPA: DsbC family protein [Geopsychrobacteraceae bacterium]|nr:DsbC family protein [Geopsychrobacteraceae bacterium]